MHVTWSAEGILYTTGVYCEFLSCKCGSRSCLWHLTKCETYGAVRWWTAWHVASLFLILHVTHNTMDKGLESRRKTAKNAFLALCYGAIKFLTILFSWTKLRPFVWCELSEKRDKNGPYGEYLPLHGFDAIWKVRTLVLSSFLVVSSSKNFLLDISKKISMPPIPSYPFIYFIIT